MLPIATYCCRYYDDFHTIDWVRDRNRDRLRQQRLNKNRKLSWKGWAKKFWDAGSGWLIVFLVGVSSGILAGTHYIFIDTLLSVLCHERKVAKFHMDELSSSVCFCDIALAACVELFECSS